MSQKVIDPTDFTLAVALFDSNGLPQNYQSEVAKNHQDICLGEWVQGVFQTIGLQSLLNISLKLEGPRYFVISTKPGFTVIIRKPACYLAILFSHELPLQPADLIPWMYDYDFSASVRHPSSGTTTLSSRQF